MKPSDIEDAIEQDRSPLLNTYTISGHSDDIIQIEGPGFGNGLELYPDTTNLHHFYLSDGTNIVRIIASLKMSQWHFGIGPYNDNYPLPIGSYELTAQGYTAILTIKTPGLLTIPEL